MSTAMVVLLHGTLQFKKQTFGKPVHSFLFLDVKDIVRDLDQKVSAVTITLLSTFLLASDSDIAAALHPVPV